MALQVGLDDACGAAQGTRAACGALLSTQKTSAGDNGHGLGGCLACCLQAVRVAGREGRRETGQGDTTQGCVRTWVQRKGGDGAALLLEAARQLRGKQHVRQLALAIAACGQRGGKAWAPDRTQRAGSRPGRPAGLVAQRLPGLATYAACSGRALGKGKESDAWLQGRRDGAAAADPRYADAQWEQHEGGGAGPALGQPPAPPAPRLPAPRAVLARLKAQIL